MSQPAHLLLSPYPVPRHVKQRVEQRAEVTLAESVTLGELRRLSPWRVLAALRRLRPDALWLLVSDHRYQPLLPLLLLVAAATRARRIRVVDYAGDSYAVSRLAVFVREPLRLAWGTARGLVELVRTELEVRRLLGAALCATAPVPPQPNVAYLKTNLWFGLQAGGSVGHVVGVINGFERCGSRVTAYAVEALPLVDPGVATVAVRGAGASGLPLELGNLSLHRAFVEDVGAALANGKPDLVYQRSCIDNYAGVVLSRQAGIPFVLEYNGSEVWVARHWGRPLVFSGAAQRIEEANLRHAHLIVVVSQVLKDELRSRGVPEERIVCYPNCVDPEVFDPARFPPEAVREVRGRWGIPPESVVVSFLGTFGPWHGAEVLAEAARRLAATRRPWLETERVVFLFVGDGQLMPTVRARLAQVPQELYRLTGLVPQHQAPELLAASDILVSPHVPNPDGSRFFGSPTKLFEYMAMGKAIVASELEQIGEVLAGSHHVGRQGTPSGGPPDLGAALLATPGSVDELAAALELLVSNPAWRLGLGAAARAQVLERYTWTHHVRAVLDSLGRLQDP